jgi:hypothetical protein
MPCVDAWAVSDDDDADDDTREDDCAEHVSDADVERRKVCRRRESSKVDAAQPTKD